jgi:hypothetical protein
MAFSPGSSPGGPAPFLSKRRTWRRRINWRAVVPFSVFAALWWGITLAAQCGRPPRPSERVLTGPDESVLAALPHVERVEVRVRPRHPKQRIIHILDWHYVPPALFEADVRAASPAALTDATWPAPFGSISAPSRPSRRSN